MRDFDQADVRSGSIASYAIRAGRGPMSAVPQKRTLVALARTLVSLSGLAAASSMLLLFPLHGDRPPFAVAHSCYAHQSRGEFRDDSLGRPQP